MIDVWKATDAELAELEAGTMIYAGEESNTGIWCGIKKNGVKVVAWSGNIKGRKDADKYVSDLMKYAEG